MQEKEVLKTTKNMLRVKLLSTLDELECIFKDLSQKGLKQIAKMQNLSQNELNKSQKCRIFYKMNLSKLLKWDALKTTIICKGKNY